MKEEEMEREALKVKRMLESKDYQTSLRKAVVRNLVGEEKIGFSIVASKGEHVIRWRVLDGRFEVDITLKGEVDEEVAEVKGYHVEKDGEYYKLFKRSKKPFDFSSEVP
ncbi:hypothetical protein EYM_05110 [Ignicoccus islandicus DSM 13165]|uniref:Uncharacterized protein n=1 Tax=Ignicoccus islandicus DSM 13165 TaxID=940295 RepID=A0A0U3G2M2_9CREN|nr:hypothetical protein [Ignicoccus islandicus]ALU12556.1 hypothetical protein EYM_05110 [Ignicoccus islandicus DSM 13165]